jgi:predicted ArsR family transcriptional regulator
MIVDHLEKQPYACAEDLALLFSKTRANIQYHLKNLAQEGLLIPVFPPVMVAERGRPRAYFALSQGERPTNFAMLAEELLNLYLEKDGDAKNVATLAKAILSLPSSSSSYVSRLNRLVKELSIRGYQARWEAHASGPEIVFRNCPYAPLLPRHPELCQMDILILQTNLGTAITQKSQIQLPLTPCCRFGGMG